MTTLHYILGSMLLLLFAYGATLNGIIMWRRITAPQKTNSSLAPIFGGVLGMIGILILPVKAMKMWWWVPLIADYGCLPLVIHAVWFHVNHKES